MAIDQCDCDRWSLVSSLCRCGNSARLWKGGSSTSTGLVPPLLHCSCRCPAAELVTVLQRIISVSCFRIYYSYHYYYVSESVTMYYLLGLPENVFFYFIVFHFILLSLNLGFIFVIFVYLSFNFIRRGGFKGDGRNLSD